MNGSGFVSPYKDPDPTYIHPIILQFPGQGKDDLTEMSLALLGPSTPTPAES